MASRWIDSATEGEDRTSLYFLGAPEPTQCNSPGLGQFALGRSANAMRKGHLAPSSDIRRWWNKPLIFRFEQLCEMNRGAISEVRSDDLYTDRQSRLAEANWCDGRG